MIKVKWGRKSPWYNPVLYTDWKWLIRLAWGKRRVSSKAPEGTPAYPSDVGAALGMWLAWIRKNIFRKVTYIVIAGDPNEGGHGARYREELRAKAEQEEAEKRKADVASRLEDLQRERRKARAERDFERADAIRQEIVDAGFTVSDEAIDKGD